MKIPKTVEGRFLKRLNRFACLVQVRGEQVECFLPNPGRLQELLTEGRAVLLLPVRGRERKTRYDLFAVRYNNAWVVVDSRVPNLLAEEALAAGKLLEFASYRLVKKEPLFGKSRLDFLLRRGGRECLLEVKSCTLVRDGVALFPDAPTARGKRHLEELMKARNMGIEARILFLIQRDDAEAFAPNDGTDREFGEALRKAAREGVEVLAYSSSFDGEDIKLGRKVQVVL